MKSNVLVATVKHGDQHGRTIGFPTINLDPTLWPKALKPGVYASKVMVNGKAYLGALYFGSRSIKDEKKSILEISLLDFFGDLYGKTVTVEIGGFVRSPIEYQPNRHNEEALQKQITQDIAQVKQLGSFQWPELYTIQSYAR